MNMFGKKKSSINFN